MRHNTQRVPARASRSTPAGGPHRGRCGFATVWLYHDDELDSDVAVKALADNWAQRIDIRERFLEEARILRRADSDHVVRVYDIGEVDGTPFFVMSYADRGSLGGLLESGVPIDVTHAVDLVEQAGVGLSVLHRQGVIHRDIKPAEPPAALHRRRRRARAGRGPRRRQGDAPCQRTDPGRRDAGVHGSGAGDRGGHRRTSRRPRAGSRGLPDADRTTDPEGRHRQPDGGSAPGRPVDGLDAAEVDGQRAAARDPSLA